MILTRRRRIWVGLLLSSLFWTYFSQRVDGAREGDSEDLTLPESFKPQIRGEFFTKNRSPQFKVQIGEVTAGEVVFLYSSADDKPLMKALYRLEGIRLKSLKIKHLERRFALTAEPDGQAWKITRAGKESWLRVSGTKPLVTHGNFYLFLLESQDQLNQGKAVIYDFFVPEDNRLVELKLSRENAGSGSLWNLKMEATSSLVRVFLRPFFLDFDYAKKIIVSGEVLDPIFSRERMKVRYFSTQSG